MRALLVDSNLWIAYLDARHEWHKKVAAALSPRLQRRRLVVPTVVKMEVLHHARRSLAGPAGQAVHDWLRMDSEAPPLDDATVDRVFHLLADHPDAIGARDAAILDHARHSDAVLATADRALATTARALGIETVVLRP